MRIGMDARKRRDGGIGTYIRSLLGALRSSPGPHRYVVFTSARDRGEISGDAMEAVPVAAGAYSITEHWTMGRVARRARLDLYHAPHYTLPLSLPCPAVVTIHDLIHIRFARFHPPGASVYARLIAGAAVRNARLVLVDSTHVRDEVRTLLRAAEERVRVIPLGVSPALSPRPADAVDAFRSARGLPRDYLLYVGARKRHKNLALLLEALGRMPPSARPPLVLSGPAWSPGDAHARAARRAGVERSIHFAGGLDGEAELSLLYSGAALYVQPSLTEGFGLPPLEAMACGTPVLSSDAGALRETLGDAATLLAPRDAGAWAEAIGPLLGDSAAREAMRHRGLTRARSYTWERTARLTRAAYEEAASRV